MENKHPMDLQRAPPTFSDLPVDVIDEIIGKLDQKYRLSLRDVSKDLRETVDRHGIEYESIRISVFEGSIHLQVNEKPIILKYMKNGDGCVLHMMNKGMVTIWKIKNMSYEEVAFKDLSILFNSTKSKIGTLYLENSADEQYEKLLNFIKSISEKAKFQFSVKCAVIHPGLSILSVFKPGTLEDIRITEKFDLECLLETPQFQQAKSVDLSKCGSIDSKYLNRFFHLINFEICLETVSAENVYLILDKISKFESLKSSRLHSIHPIAPHPIPLVKHLFVYYVGYHCVTIFTFQMAEKNPFFAFKW